MVRFELPTLERQKEALEYIQEHRDHQSNINGSGGLDRATVYKEWLHKILNSHKGIEPRENRVPASTFFAIDSNDKIVGMVNIRHRLNDFIIEHGYGHIGYGVRPTERRKGYATEMLRLALLECSKLGLKEIEISANSDNIGSTKTILKNGGIPKETKIEEDGKELIVYTIKI